MSELRRDPVTGRWIIVVTENARGPEEFPVEPHREPEGRCPFCPGNEPMTPPEMLARRQAGGAPNSPGWSLRIIPNKFPALRIEGSIDRVGEGVYDKMNGIGAHEVIIETPDHRRDLSDFRPEEMAGLFETFRHRSLDLRQDKRFRYVLIFKNVGESAGASLAHPHFQLIALPIVPKRVFEELKRADAYFDHKERCVFCDCIHQEIADGKRVVLESDHSICFAPFASRFPFELWILPKNHLADFASDSKEVLADAGKTLQWVLKRVRELLHEPSYNFLIHTSPLDAMAHEGYHWHIEIMPRLTRVAGFEWGSGFYINPTPPELAAQYLRQGGS